MQTPNKKRSDELRGAGKLTVEAITGITDIVERLHSTILRFGTPSATGRTGGITGGVYRIVRFFTRAVGTGVDVLLAQLGSILGESGPSANKEAVLSALNGVLGDYLAQRSNPLAIAMQFRRNGEPISTKIISDELQKNGGRLLILIHGLCMNDNQWDRNGHNHGRALEHAWGCSPIYLHYNTGLHISENGSLFADKLEQLIKSLPPNTHITLLGHSMGGLVARSACQRARQRNYAWVKQLETMIFLGSPHHGAPLERGGNGIDVILEISPYSAPFSRLGKIRSSGITDLRYGNVMEEDWKHVDRFEPVGDQRVPVPLPPNVKCYTVGATMHKAPQQIPDELLGDGLVPLPSALGIHPDPHKSLKFTAEHQFVVRGVNHLDLLNDAAVYAQLLKWLKPM